MKIKGSIFAMALMGSAMVATAADTSKAQAGGDAVPLWSHVRRVSDLGELRNMTAQWDASQSEPVLRLTSSISSRALWAVIPAPKTGWDLARRAAVQCEMINRGTAPVTIMFWVVGARGWDAVGEQAKLEPGLSRIFSCKLRASFPDGTPKLDPGQVRQVQIMVSETKGPPGSTPSPAVVEVRGLVAVGEVPEWKRPPGRLDVPDVEDASPKAGHRVRYRLNSDKGIYCILNLPEDWQPGRKYPVIAELPGNIYYTVGCYSTGLPDQCTIGYGMSQGKGVICLGLPFVDRKAAVIAESGWGNADDTAEYTVNMVEEVCAKFGGDRQNLFITGFSRGAIACGYIGLRNDRIAALWKGMHCCQHYDGDGWGSATRPTAIERARRFRGLGIFQTDNRQKDVQPMMDVMKAPVTLVGSGLGAHATAMFLDDRPSTKQLREWFWKLCGKTSEKRTLTTNSH